MPLSKFVFGRRALSTTLASFFLLAIVAAVRGPAAAQSIADAETDIVIIGDVRAMTIITTAWPDIDDAPMPGPLQIEEPPKPTLGFADSEDRGRLLELFCRLDLPRPIDALALSGPMDRTEAEACAGTPLAAFPLGGLLDEATEGAPKILTLYVKTERIAGDGKVRTFARTMTSALMAGLGGALHRAGVWRLEEETRRSFLRAAGNGEPFQPKSFAPADLLARGRTQGPDGTFGQEANHVILTGHGKGYSLVSSAARDFAAAQGYGAPESYVTGWTHARRAFCRGENTALPDILIMDRRMNADEWADCEARMPSHIWMTEFFLGHVVADNGFEPEEVFLYAKRNHWKAIPAVAALLEHILSDEMLGQSGRFAADGLLPPAPLTREALMQRFQNPAPILGAGDLQTAVPAPFRPTVAPDWATDRVIDGPRLALIIGNGGYGADLGPLRNPVNDAKDMGAALAAVGFTVFEHHDLGFKDMRRAVRDFAKAVEAAGDNATALFFFSGHGMQSEGLTYLAPIDADIEDESDIGIEAVDASAVLQRIEDAGAAFNMLILDACRNNLFSRATRSRTRGLAPMRADENTLILYATRPGDVAFDGDGDNSPFTTALLEAIEGPPTPVEFSMKEVARSVRIETDNRQSPWIEGVLLGNFYFKPPV